VGGTINLQSVLPINNPYITILGQTAPGGGITVSAKAGYFDAIGMNTHNIIIRYIRFARGYYLNHPDETGDTISLFGPANTSSSIMSRPAGRTTETRTSGAITSTKRPRTSRFRTPFSPSRWRTKKISISARTETHPKR
jgi:hypothetical protein